ncbi:MAG: ROK family protein [Alphaproteobacteria bacterium]|nr:ROK family protein [Alphaproteobacteria bacterium]
MRIGVDLGGTKIEFIALSDDGTLLAGNRIPAPQNNYQDTLTAIKEGVLTLEKSLKLTGSVGVGIPGTVSSHTGRIKGANPTWLIGKPIDIDLQNELNRPIRVANDANCFTLSEAIDGAGADYNNVFGVILGTGVGGGLVVNNQSISGANGMAGEWGHSPQPRNSENSTSQRPCYCGKKDCVETYLSGPGFSKSFYDLSGLSLSPQEIMERVRSGDQVANSVMSAYEYHLARGLAGVINLLDPDVIILGGGLSNIERLYETVPVLWQDWCFSDHIDTPLKPPKHGDSSGVRGAAWLWPIE